MFTAVSILSASLFFFPRARDDSRGRGNGEEGRRGVEKREGPEEKKRRGEERELNVQHSFIYLAKAGIA